MTRKRESIIEILAMCPWWVSVAASVIAYIVLRDFLPHIHAGDKLTAPIVTGLGQLAYVSAPYVAILLLLPLPFSLFNAWQRKQTLENQTGLKSIRDLDWKTFEQLVGEVFRRQGFAVAETGQGGADGGLDLALRKGSEVFLVQCKQWRAYKVSVNVVRELYGVMAAKGTAGGFVITSGNFTEDAKAFAAGRNIELIDGPRLEKMIASIQTTTQSRKPAIDSTNATPTCPKCNSPMVKRTARQGANAGGQFWGCSRYPGCRGIRSIN